MLIVDAGLRFPEDDMLGIDFVIPDMSYLIENKDKVKGIAITHPHEDHIGAIPYVLKEIPDVPIFGSKLACGIINNKLKEAGIKNNILVNIEARQKINVGNFRLEFIHMNHSIPDAMSIVIHTPYGAIVYTGDFKIDQTPVDGRVTDFYRLASLGEKGVLALLSDSTGAEKPGFTPSEKSSRQE